MEISNAVRRLSALAHDGRLNVFRCLVRVAPAGISAGEIAANLNIQPNTLSAQLNILSAAELVRRQRQGRSIVYHADLAALNEMMLYLIEDCCQGRDEVCAPLLEALTASEC